MIALIQTGENSFARIHESQWITSLDGQFKASGGTVMNPNWSDEERAVYGVILVEEQFAPSGHDAIGERFEIQDGTVVHILDVVERPAPPVQPITPLQFMQRFTAEERTIIRNCDNDYVDDFFDLLRAATEVHLDNELVAQGMALLVGLELLTQARADEILQA